MRSLNFFYEWSRVIDHGKVKEDLAWEFILLSGTLSETPEITIYLKINGSISGTLL